MKNFKCYATISGFALGMPASKLKELGDYFASAV